jgi:uncharacterized membrane protein YgcG
MDEDELMGFGWMGLALVIIIAVVLIFTCNGPKHTNNHPHSKGTVCVKEQIKVYKIKKSDTKDFCGSTGNFSSASTASNAISNNDWLFYYIITMNNNCYYYSSSTPVSDVSKISWTKTESSPINVKSSEVEEEIKMEEPVEVETSPTSEGISTESENSAESSSSDESGGSESSSSSEPGGGESGGGESGGGDCGGGDGGGGGD